MKTYIFRLALVAAGVATSLPAAAADHPLADRIFERMDTNNDDKVDAGEMEQARAARFKRLDANGDGVVSAAEQDRAQNRVRRRAAMREEMMARQFERLDADGDQAVSGDEFFANQPLARADANKDGVVTREEFGAAADTLRSLRSGRK